MRSHFAAGDFTAVKQADQIGPGDVEKVSGLLGRELHLEWHDGDRVALGHLGQNIFEQPGGGGRNDDGLLLLAFTNLESKPTPFVGVAGKNAPGSQSETEFV